MKITRKIISISMLIVLLFSMAIPTFASENTITPRYKNTGSTEALFMIEDDGLADVSFTCIGYQGITTRIEVKTIIEKKVLWWWNEVEGAHWVVFEYDCALSGYHEIQLTQRGTYRATITYTVAGTGGEADVITSQIVKEY